MRNTFFVILVIIASYDSFCQVKVGGIKGVLKDSVSNQFIHNAVVTVINNKDSLIVVFGYSDQQGRYFLNNIGSGDYQIIVSHTRFADYTEHLILNESELADLGVQFLTSKYKIMEEVIIRQKRAAMEIKNDTLIFLADSFKVRENATVEELLKALPGITVNRDGQIRIQGQRVNQVLVDGEEFFGNDPTIVTQNLQSKIIDKVQVFDKKSEESKLTGIDDGNSVKVINLKLKETAKKGYFGKVVAGSNFNRNWNGSLMVNSFKGKRQLSVFAMTSNIGRTIIDRSDQSKFGFRLNERLGGGISSLNDSYYDVGIPKSFGGGIHYANKLYGDKLTYNTNILLGLVGNKGIQTNNTQYYIGDSLLLFSDKYFIDNRRTEYSWDGEIMTILDSMSSLSAILKVRNGKMNADNSLSSKAENSHQVINDSRQIQRTESAYDNYSGSLEWRKKINKAGKGLFAILKYEYLSNSSSGNLNAINRFYSSGSSLLKQDTINLKRNRSSVDYSVSTKMGYTVPAFNIGFLSLDYNFSLSNFAADWKSFDTKLSGVEPIDSLTSNYSYLMTVQSAGISYRMQKKKFNIAFGQNASLLSYEQKDKLNQMAKHYSFFKLLPNASISYSFGKLTSLRLSYMSGTTPPTIRQIQPLVDNTNSLILYRGNPNLTQEFNSTYTIVFNSNKLVQKRTLYSSLSFNINKNAISYSEFLDTAGKRIIQPVNTRHSSRVFGYLNYTFEVKSIKANWTNDLTYLKYNNISFVNFNEINNSNATYTYTTSLSKNTKHISLEISTAMIYNIIKYTKINFRGVEFWSNKSYVSFDCDLPWRMEFGNNCQFLIQQASPYFNRSSNFIQWNTYVSRKLFKKENGIFRFAINNILDQNTGYTRLATGNYVSERLTETLGRYWLLTFILNFNNKSEK